MTMMNEFIEPEKQIGNIKKNREEIKKQQFVGTLK